MADPARSGEPTDATRDGDGSTPEDSSSGPESTAPGPETESTTDASEPVSETGTRSTASDSDPVDEADGDGTASGSGPREREVVVPTHVYKRVTVFSTLFAVVAVVAGFLVLDEATDRATAPLSETDPVLALVGIGLIVVGAVTYAFSTRFRAEGMGNAKDESDEPSDNG